MFTDYLLDGYNGLFPILCFLFVGPTTSVPVNSTRRGSCALTTVCVFVIHLHRHHASSAELRTKGRGDVLRLNC
jgi:hypothetical protein